MIETERTLNQIYIVPVVWGHGTNGHNIDCHLPTIWEQLTVGLYMRTDLVVILLCELLSVCSLMGQW